MYCSVISFSLFFNIFLHTSVTLSTNLSSEALNLVNNESISKPAQVLTNLNTLDNIKASHNYSLKSMSSLDVAELLSPNSINKSFESSKKSELIYDYDEYYDDDESDDQSGYESETNTGRYNTRRRRIFFIKRVGTTYAWGRWEKWSRCSNSCVQIRKRQCIKRIQNTTDDEALEITFYPNLADETTGCFGIMKKYRLCKDEKCKFSNRRMRDEQCSTYNRQPFKGKFYNWQGYEKEHNECELYCKPMDSDIFISMNQSVTDGTPCEKPAIYYTHYYRRKAVCVEGICKVFNFFCFHF